MGNKMNSSQLNILLQGEYEQEDIEKLKSRATELVDIYESQLKELFKIQNPDLDVNGEEANAYIAEKNKGDMSGAWVYYPWNKTLLHCVDPDDLYAIRTNRNKNIITEDEQLKLKHSVIGVAGMSVGAGIALSLAYSGIADTIKIADFDELDTSNLNRLRENLLSVGQKKSVLALRHILELDPFLNVHEFSEGLNESNIDDFFALPKLSVVVDEIDDFKMKIKLRLKAKEYGIPLVMFTSLGDNILVDIERYDTDINLQLFHGLIGDIPNEILVKNEITEADIRKYSVQIVGAEYIPTRALASVAEMGKSLVGRPQLYSTIAVDGGLGAYVVRQILLNNQPKSGRYFIKFADLMNVENDDIEDSEQRRTILNRMKLN